MSTTKIDLMRDILKDALIDLDFNFDPTNDGDGTEEEIEFLMDETIEDMLSALELNDGRAYGTDFTVRVVMDKEKRTVSTDYGDITPSDDKGSIIL